MAAIAVDFHSLSWWLANFMLQPKKWDSCERYVDLNSADDLWCQGCRRHQPQLVETWQDVVAQLSQRMKVQQARGRLKWVPGHLTKKSVKQHNFKWNMSPEGNNRVEIAAKYSLVAHILEQKLWKAHNFMYKPWESIYMRLSYSRQQILGVTPTRHLRTAQGYLKGVIRSWVWI